MSTSPGWYRDPAEPESQRYWNGEQWVGEHLPLGVEPPEGPLNAPTPAVPAPPQAPAPPAGRYAEPGRPGAHEPQGPQPDPAQPGAWYPARGRGAPGAPAPLADRLAARLVDGIALLLLNLVVNGYFLYQLFQELLPVARAAQAGDPQPEVSSHANTLSLVISLVAMALWFAYEVPAVAATGQTLGKRLLGIQVVAVDGGPLGFRRSIQRWIPQGAPLLLWGLLFVVQLLDWAWCLWDKPLRQCLHDKAARTVVVNAPPQHH
jgi:uncharacterized RDD family membrane protein YckC